MRGTLARHRDTIAAAVLLTVAAGLTAWQAIRLIDLMTPAGIPVSVDWQTYANTVNRFVSGSAIYAPIQVSGTPYEMPSSSLIGYSYPPPSIVLMLPFANVPLGVAAWYAILLGSFLLGLAAALRRELGSGWLLGLGVALALLATLKPLSSAIVSGNASLLIAGVYAWSWTWDRAGPRRLPVLATAALAVLKIVPGALAATLWRELGWRTAVLAGLAVAGFSLVTLPLVGGGPWQDYPTVLGQSLPVCGGPIPSVACAGISAGLSVPTAKAAGVIVGAGCFALAVVVPWRPLSFALVGLAMLAPTTDLHDHVMLIPAVTLIVLFAAWVGDLRRRASLPAALGPVHMPSRGGSTRSG